MNNDITYKLNYKVYTIQYTGFTKMLHKTKCRTQFFFFFFNLVRAWNEDYENKCISTVLKNKLPKNNDYYVYIINFYIF